jgi:hypothetical protein
MALETCSVRCGTALIFFSLSRSWKPVIRDLMEYNPAPNKNTTPSSEAWKWLFFLLPFFYPTPSPPPCNLPEGSLLVRTQFPYSFPLIGSLPSALALQILYKPLYYPALSLQLLKMETACFSETSASTCKYTWRQNLRRLQQYVNFSSKWSV